MATKMIEDYVLIYVGSKIAVHDPFISSIYHRLDATNAWGHINIFAKGAGHAVAQLDVNYGVDYEPFKVIFVLLYSCRQ